ncbi:MAG: redox-regulated ATPase YchF [Chloroflexi bacterium]|nr:redox-regulated ATPase YchF [Chloroflexota bacterium]MCI0576926.1 redox-regulated ATPase YchF [Chloroflexota bacterium]MCI0646926.1 redox-regulated ATPase YchF [Chloroflexota bacterium]MCI0731310.1 redox-regulated ATPase YchF [Chloroflexota bacterium]
MKLGIIGLPGSGKTTIFNALTRGNAPTGQSMGGRFDVLTAVVDVPDKRVDVLSDLFRPQKTTYAKVTYTDVAGLQKGMGESGGMSGPILNHLAGLDGFVHVVRAFADENVPHLEGSVDPARDLAILDTEFLLNDLLAVEGKLERLREGLAKGAFKNKAAAEVELALFEQLHGTLAGERPLRELALDEESLKSLRGYGLLTLKPVLVVANIGDDQAEVALEYPYRHSLVANLRGKLEMELAQLSGDDLALFMEEYHVAELGLDRVIHLSYELMGLLSFFTVGEDEVRAWTVQRGATALDAAATIHTDLARGFIRAEVIPVDQLVALGGLAEARAAGKLRLEGKTYLVQDGDIIHIKFNI